MIPLLTPYGFTPLTPDSDEARRLAERELSKRMYLGEDTLLTKFFTWLGEIFEDIVINLDPTERGTGNYIVIGVILFLIALVIVLAVRRGRVGSARASRTARVALFDDDRTSAQLFAAAEAAERAGDLNLAVVELYRGIVRLLDERELITVIPGMTAFEAARAGGDTLGNMPLFTRCATTFNEIYYWHGKAGGDDVRALHELHRQVTQAQVVA
ncbi:DUF4129 domain-containing protein [Trueperella bialowiezensis]|nr:DUF4129 domain-containing protein [Trueperella bialowiezensis]